jgi:hypothetical protein
MIDEKFDASTNRSIANVIIRSVFLVDFSIDFPQIRKKIKKFRISSCADAKNML